MSATRVMGCMIAYRMGIVNMQVTGIAIVQTASSRSADHKPSLEGPFISVPGRARHADLRPPASALWGLAHVRRYAADRKRRRRPTPTPVRASENSPPGSTIRRYVSGGGYENRASNSGASQTSSVSAQSRYGRFFGNIPISLARGDLANAAI